MDTDSAQDRKNDNCEPETLIKEALPQQIASVANEHDSPNQLSPAEQMALFEKELKESDWGHQPC